ncbi:MAG: acetylglutamate kinase [Rhodospirillales bacterium]|nr:acetylglutamate kinase [Rhodospirillales bacterium]
MSAKKGKSSSKPLSPELEKSMLAKAAVLHEALPFIRRYAGKTFVIKYGGHAMGEERLAHLFARDIVLLRQVGIRPVVVHGGGPQIGDMLKRLKIESTFVDGLRVTDRATMDVAEMVLSGLVNKQIVQAINDAGGFAVGLSGKDGHLVRAERVKRVKRDPGSKKIRTLDLGLVGEPKEITPHILRSFEQSDIIPVIAPIGFGSGGETLNINADTVAGAIAAAIGAVRLFMLTDVKGVLGRDKSLIPEMTAKDVRAAIKDGTISGGMIPKVETCLAAVAGGVEGAVVLDGRVPHVVLLELFTERGAGTLIRAG